MTRIKFQKESPLHSLNQFPSSLDFFRDLFESGAPVESRKQSIPAVNIIENENAYRLELAVPGLNKEDFQLKVEKNILTISAEKKQSTHEENEKYSRREFAYQGFSRSFTLPESVNIDGIQARYEAGVMHIELPKLQPTKPAVKEIAIS